MRRSAAGPALHTACKVASCDKTVLSRLAQRLGSTDQIGCDRGENQALQFAEFIYSAARRVRDNRSRAFGSTI